MDNKNDNPDRQGAPQENDAFNKNSTWARPMAMARDTNVAAWFALAGAILLVVALWAPISRAYWSVRNASANKEKDVPRTEKCFLAIAYEGVSHLPDPSGRFISADVFRTHIQALRDAGYHPIGLEDVRAFFYENKLLPPKAILLTFDNARKSTYFESREIIDELGWHAVMGVVTKKVGTKDTDVILTPYLKSMVLDSRWDLACESNQGLDFVTVSPQGRKAPYLSAPLWFAGEKRYERTDEFKARIEEDHKSALEIFESKLGTKPIAFFFPLGNYGQFEQSNRLLRDANLNTVASHYPLGFALNNQALNEASTDRRRINRALIPANMTAKTLLATLDSAWPFDSNGETGSKPIDVIRWVADWGIIEKESESFTLRAMTAEDQRFSDAGATIGGRAWLSGSSQFSDGTFETLFELVRGEFHVYLRYRSEDEWVKVALTEGGRATVGQCRFGGEPEIVASDAIRSDIDFRTVHNLFITMRENLVYVRLDGALLFKGPVLLPTANEGPAAPGLIGISVQGPDPGLAQSRVRECHVRPRVNGVITWPASLNREPSYLVSQLNESVFRYTVISPPWLDVNPSAPLAFPSIDAAAMRVVATANRARVFPLITLHAQAPLPGIERSKLANQLVDEGADGVFIDASDFPVDRISQFKAWLDELDNLLSVRKLGLAVKFPSSVSHLASLSSSLGLDSNHLLVVDDATVPAGIDANNTLTRIVIPPPADEDDIAIVFQLSDYENVAEDELPEIDMLRSKGFKAYVAGDYHGATNFFTRWRSLEPSNSEAWAMLGNALARIPDPKAAIAAYNVALRLNPGQVDLMVECARLLEANDQPEKAAELLDTYARAFPEDAKIAIAQANWLERHGKRSAGREILTSLIARHDNDILSRLALHNLLEAPADRYMNMHALLKIGSSGGPSRLLGFGHDIAESEILTMPESSVFFDFIRDTASSGDTEALRTLYSEFLPPLTPITERFDTADLSDHWTARGTPRAVTAGTYDIQAAADMAEASLRLKQSELFRDGYMEVHLGESVGAFWIYARRSGRAMIRFGFNDDGYIRIQSWKNGEIRTGDSASWIRPSGDIVLRLEIRGDGAMGYVDGHPMFHAPLMIPHDIAYGWWSVAPYSSDLGSARARISLISAGPQNPALVLMREYKPEKIVDALESLRAKTRYISALAPVMFEQAPDGTVLSTPLADFMPFRMFCSYHRIRLMPAVALDYYSDVNSETLVKIIQEHNLSGLVLLVRTMPDEKWYKKTTSLLENTSANLVIVQREFPVFSEDPPKPGEEVATIREIQRGSTLFQPNELSWGLAIQSFDEWYPATAIPSASPQVVLLGGPKARAVEEEPVPAPEESPAKPEEEPAPAPEESPAEPEKQEDANPPAPQDDSEETDEDNA